MLLNCIQFSYGTSKVDRFILHVVQGSVICYLNQINCSVFGEVENHFVPVV